MEDIHSWEYRERFGLNAPMPYQSAERPPKYTSCQLWAAAIQMGAIIFAAVLIPTYLISLLTNDFGEALEIFAWLVVFACLIGLMLSQMGHTIKDKEDRHVAKPSDT